MLTRLILQEAERFCLEYGFSLECKLDSDMLRHAAETIRNSPELGGAPNPWYGTDYLNKSLITSSSWASRIRCKAKRDAWCKEWRAEQEAARQRRIESGEELDYDALLASLKSQEVQR